MPYPWKHWSDLHETVATDVPLKKEVPTKFCKSSGSEVAIRIPDPGRIYLGRCLRSRNALIGMFWGKCPGECPGGNVRMPKYRCISWMWYHLPPRRNHDTDSYRVTLLRDPPSHTGGRVTDWTLIVRLSVCQSVCLYCACHYLRNKKLKGQEARSTFFISPVSHGRNVIGQGRKDADDNMA